MSTRRDEPRPACPRSAGPREGARPLSSRPVAEIEDLDGLFEQSLPAFGGAILRRAWTLLDEAIGRGVPMTLSVAGPVTASGQHLAWLNPLLDTGWFATVSTTDAACYHDAHRGLDGAAERPFFSVPLHGDDTALREERVIRITDVGFEEEVLLETDRFLRACLARPEFQREMSGTLFRSLLGRRYAAQERKNGAPEGLLALCHRKAIPVFVGAPADGSIFLNSVCSWALAEVGQGQHHLRLDLHQEVFENCSYHYWGLFASEARALGTLILGGGVPKNFNLQPEPTLEQILGLRGIRGFLYDIQITTAPVTDGSLSSCPPAEGVTWGKVDKDHHRSTCCSLPCDYSMVMPFLVKALLEKRRRLERLAAELGEGPALERHPEARGYLRDPGGYRLLEQREELMAELMEQVRAGAGALRAAASYPLAPSPP